MGSTILQIAMYVAAGCALGGLVAWSVLSVRGKRRTVELTGAMQQKLHEAVGQRDDLANQYSEARSRLQQLAAASSRRGAERDAALEKSERLAKSVRILKKEREGTKIKLGTLQNALTSLRQQTSNLQHEFDKTREFYKRELLKSLQKRKDLEEDIVKARAEQESFARAMEASVLEHGSEENMVVAAQLRLGQLEVLERNVQKLEAENSQLRQDSTQLKQKYDSRERELKELEELKVHNRQLIKAVEALEDSRKEYENDAERFRQQADESEKMSNTLQLKLEDLEKSFAEIEQQQDQALEDAREAEVLPILRQQG